MATVIFSYFGGIDAVIWTDVTQLGIYLIGAFVAAFILLGKIPGGWNEVISAGGATGCKEEIGFGVSFRMAPIRLAWLFPSNAFLPVIISYSTTPKAKMSVRASAS